MAIVIVVVSHDLSVSILSMLPILSLAVLLTICGLAERHRRRGRSLRLGAVSCISTNHWLWEHKVGALRIATHRPLLRPFLIPPHISHCLSYLALIVRQRLPPWIQTARIVFQLSDALSRPANH